MYVFKSFYIIYQLKTTFNPIVYTNTLKPVFNAMFDIYIYMYKTPPGTSSPTNNRIKRFKYQSTDIIISNY